MFTTRHNPNKLLALLALFITVTVVPFPVPVQALYNQTSAINYLRSNSQDEWIIMALGAANSLSGISLDFLKTDPGSSATDVEKRILALIAAGQNPQTFGQVNLIDRLASLYNGTEIAPTQNLLNDDIFGLLALAGSSERSDIQAQLKTLLKQNQNSDGGWSFGKAPSASDSNMTAMALMALLASGESPASNAINIGYAYLSSTKTATGYRFDTGSGFGPDAASTAWVLSALIAGNRTLPEEAVNYLQDLQLSNGSFSWQAGQTGSPLISAFAIIALQNQYYPVRNSNQPPVAPIFPLKILGPNQTQIFNGNVSFNQVSFTDQTGATHTFASPVAIGTITETAKSNSLSYVIRKTSLGLFVESIAGIGTYGTQGWLYAVNGSKPSVSAEQFILQNTDKVMWFYGSPNDPVPSWDLGQNSDTSANINLRANIESSISHLTPTVTLTASKNSITLGETVTLNWNSQNATVISQSAPNAFAGNILNGQLTVQPAQTTTYTISVQGPGGIATASVTIQVNSTPAIVFGIDVQAVNFGTLQPGQSSAGWIVQLQNQGQTNLRVTASLSNSDSLYQQGLRLGSNLWSNFQRDLNANVSQSVVLTLEVPSNYSSTGIKTGTLTFWANPR